MTIHVLVEGPSELAFLQAWASRLVPGHSIRVHPHQGKGSLPAALATSPNPRKRGVLDQLPAKLRGFAASLDPAKDGVLVLVDADNDSCSQLAADISKAATACAPRLNVVVRIAVEEMEAFYLGDQRGLKVAFPDADLDRARAYSPDSIVGTWELFGDIIGDPSGSKVLWAEKMGPRITTSPARSRSPSFKALCRGLLRLAQPRPAKPKGRSATVRRSKRHRAATGRRSR